MSEQSDKWAVNGGGGRVLCPKHGIYITNCAFDLDCERCIEERGLAPKTEKKRGRIKKTSQ